MACVINTTKAMTEQDMLEYQRMLEVNERAREADKREQVATDPDNAAKLSNMEDAGIPADMSLADTADAPCDLNGGLVGVVASWLKG